MDDAILLEREMAREAGWVQAGAERRSGNGA
jgi:hypothetical protein